MRLPAGSEYHPRSADGCTLYIKTAGLPYLCRDPFATATPLEPATAAGLPQVRAGVAQHREKSAAGREPTRRSVGRHQQSLSEAPQFTQHRDSDRSPKKGSRYEAEVSN